MKSRKLKERCALSRTGEWRNYTSPYRHLLRWWKAKIVANYFFAVILQYEDREECVVVWCTTDPVTHSKYSNLDTAKIAVELRK